MPISLVIIDAELTHNRAARGMAVILLGDRNEHFFYYS